MLKRMRSRWIAAAGAVITIATGIFMLSTRTPTAAPASVLVQRGNIEDTVLATGRIRAAQLVNVGAQVTGQVTTLHVTLGQTVKKGQPIAEIDALPQQNALRNAAAQVRSASARLKARQATLVQLRLEARRQGQLIASQSTAQAEQEAAQAAFDAAVADVDALGAELEQARIAQETAQLNLSYTRVIAPMDGIVVAIVTEQGQTVNANQSAPTIVKLADVGTMLIKAQISEADISRVRSGMPAYFTLMGRDQSRHRAALTDVEPGPVTISQSGNDGTGASAAESGSAKAVYYNANLRIPNESGSLRIDMTAKVTIVVAQARQVVAVPSSTVTVDGDGSSVQVIDQDGRIAARRITTGLDNRSQVEVRSGLRPGERVLVRGEGP